MLITDKGVLVRTRVSEIRELGRATQGVTLIALDDGTKLSGLQRIVENDANEADANAEGGDPADDDTLKPPRTDMISRNLGLAPIVAVTLALAAGTALADPSPAKKALIDKIVALQQPGPGRWPGRQHHPGARWPS